MAKFTNYCFKTNGTSQYLIVPADGTSGGDYGSGNNKVFTISLWFLRKTNTQWVRGIVKWAKTTTAAADPYLAVGTYAISPPTLNLRTNGVATNVQANSFVFDTWNHLVITRTAGASGVTTVYMNGVADPNTSVGPGTANEAEATHLLFSFPYWDTSSYGPNLLTDIAIWDVALDATTVGKIYNSGTPNDLTLAASYDVSGGGTDASGDLTGYWRPDKSTFTGVGPQWAIPDESTSSNTMDSVLMDVLDKSGTAPNSLYNGSTVNMAIDDRVTPGAS